MDLFPTVSLYTNIEFEIDFPYLLCEEIIHKKLKESKRRRVK